MRNLWNRGSALVVTALLAGGCGGGNDPSVSAPIIAKAGTKSGDAQSGPAGQPLPNSLRVEVTRDGAPASGIAVTWATSSGGSLTPTSAQTDADGVSSSSWTLGSTGGQQSATASVQGGLNSTAPSPPPRPAEHRGPRSRSSAPRTGRQPLRAGQPDGDPRQDGHLAVGGPGRGPQRGAGRRLDPPPSGTLVDAPHTYQYTFNALGTFHYHCEAHGASGMTGSVTVVAPPPPD
jgi:Plastocyanin